MVVELSMISEGSLESICQKNVEIGDTVEVRRR